MNVFLVWEGEEDPYLLNVASTFDIARTIVDKDIEEMIDCTIKTTILREYDDPSEGYIIEVARGYDEVSPNQQRDDIYTIEEIKVVDKIDKSHQLKKP